MQKDIIKRARSTLIHLLKQMPLGSLEYKRIRGQLVGINSFEEGNEHLSYRLLLTRRFKIGTQSFYMRGWKKMHGQRVAGYALSLISQGPYPFYHEETVDTVEQLSYLSMQFIKEALHRRHTSGHKCHTLL